MIAIAGNIKVDESKPERIKYLIACIRSYRFLKDDCRFILHLENPSFSLFEKIHHEICEFKKSHVVLISSIEGYGKQYVNLLEQCKDCDFVINFMEDQFMVLDDIRLLNGITDLMQQEEVDILKASFFEIERNSSRDRSLGINYPHYGFVYDNSLFNFNIYQRYYKSRYYIGVNFITTHEFAARFWNRELGNKPHPYEVVKHDSVWQHRIMIPNIEIQCAIDDDHGESNTCLLKRNDCEKWNRIWGEVKQIEV